MKRILTLLMMLSAVPVSGQTTLSNTVFGNGGSEASSAGFLMRTTSGQPTIGAAALTSNAVNLGFWYDIAGPAAIGVSVENTGETVPESYRLDQNYPNPFNPTTTIVFAVPEPAHVRVDIYNVLGQHVKSVHNGKVAAGEYRAVWNGRDSSGQLASSGLYFYQIDTGSFQMTKSMILMK